MMSGAMLVVSIVTLLGCAIPKPEFDQTYLPNATPGSPQKRLVLPQDVVDKRVVISKGLFGNESKGYLGLELFWIEEDNMILNILNEDNQSVRYSYLVLPRSGEFKLLEGAEKDALVGTVEKSVSIQSNETTAGAIARGVWGYLSNTMKNYFLATVENNGQKVDFDIKAVQELQSGSGKFGGFKSTVKAYIEYSAKNNQTGKSLEGTRYFNPSSYAGQYTIHSWLKTWKVSPDGQNYMIGGYTLINADKREFIPLIKNYEYHYYDSAVNPKWTNIALLVVKQDELDKEKYHHLIEFYPLSVNSSLTAATTN